MFGNGGLPDSVKISPNHQGEPLTRSGFSAPVVTAIAPSKFAVVLSDKDGNVKDRIEHVTSAIRWTWLGRGGYSRAGFQVNGDYLRFQPNADDDVKIYLPNSSGGAFLAYRGLVEKADPELSTGNKGMIKIECNGYFSQLSRTVVQTSGAEKTFTSAEVSSIVGSLIDDFVVANFSITKGTIDVSTFVVDSISFKSTVKSALETLFNLLGNVHYGVDENLVFYWRTFDETTAHKFFLGDKVVKLTDRVDFKNIVNKIYFEGGDVSGAAFTRTGQSQSSIDKYGLHESILSNGSIATSSVAERYISGILRQKSKPVRQFSVRLVNTTKRLESSLPIGAVSVVDSDSAQFGALYGTTANGGDNKIYGTVGSGGSGQVYGGVAKHQVERIDYELSPEDGRLTATVTFGSSLTISEASAGIKRIENQLEAVNQRSL